MGRTKRLLASTLASITAAFGMSVLSTADGARADTTASLSGFYQMAVDSTNHHLFFSQGGNSILVTDFAGHTVTSITGQDRVTGIALSPDGRTLYAALVGKHAVSAISTATLTQTALYPLGNDTFVPEYVAVQSGKLWVSYFGGDSGAIGDFDLSATTPTFATQTSMSGWYSPPLLAADPSDTSNVLVAIQPDQDPTPTVDSYDTGVNPPTLRAQSNSLPGGTGGQVCGEALDAAVIPGGSQFIPACGRSTDAVFSSGVFTYSTADMSQHGSYATGLDPNSIAIAPDNGTVAVGMGAATGPGGEQDIDVYAPGGSKPLNVFSTGYFTWVAPRGLGMTANASKLFVVTEGGGAKGGSYYTLHVYDNPTITRSALNLNGSVTGTAGHAITLTGQLTLDNGTNPPSGTAISITRTGGGSRTALLKASTTANGSFTLPDNPPKRGTYTYTASYAGNARTRPSTKSLTITYAGLRAGLTLTASPATDTYEPVITVTAHLGATYTNHTVAIYARPFGGARKLLAAGRVDSRGDLTVHYRAPHSTTFSAVFAGDARYAPRTVSRPVYIRVRIAMVIGGYYASKTISGITYRLYHRSADLVASVAVAPAKSGECVKLEAQESYQGAWHPNAITTCGTLNSKSETGGYLILTQADLGYPYRVRADYIRGSDTSNLSTDTGWQYFMVEK